MRSLKYFEQTGTYRINGIVVLIFWVELIKKKYKCPLFNQIYALKHIDIAY